MATKHICIELGSGVFDKPQALGDYLVQLKASRTIVICPNTSDIRFVENILRRRSLPARRITEFLEDNDLVKIIDWLESQNNIIVVCGVKAGQKISKELSSNVIVYTPLSDTEGYEQISGSSSEEESRVLVTLVSPQELAQYQNVKKFLPSVETIQVAETDSISAQKEILDRAIQALPARGSTLANELTAAYAADLGLATCDSASPAFTTLKKLVTFLMENNLGSAPKSSIEEELQIIEPDNENDDEGQGRKSWNGNSKKPHHKGDKRDRNNNHSGPRDKKGHHGKKHSNDRHDRNDRNDRHDRNDRNDRGRKGHKKQVPQYFPVRIYVGLGEDNGLKPHEVKDFIAKNAHVDREEIGFATVRSAYSFVDITKQAADKALSRESGYEFEGKLITVERAVTASAPRKKNYRNNHDHDKTSEDAGHGDTGYEDRGHEEIAETE